jgi:hypothetical protein
LVALPTLGKNCFNTGGISVNGCSEPFSTKLRMSLLEQIDGYLKELF